MWQTVVWAGVFFLLGGAAIWRVDRYANARLELMRQRQESAEADATLTRQERQTAADLAARTVDETAELEKARLLKEAAEARAAAVVAEDEGLIEARIAEEAKVIAARTEGRALAAKERAVREGDNASPLALLTEAYLQACQDNHVAWTFNQWLGNREIPH